MRFLLLTLTDENGLGSKSSVMYDKIMAVQASVIERGACKGCVCG